MAGLLMEANNMVRQSSAKQARFVREYAVDCNGAAAAVRAGYSPRSAKVTASRLLTRQSTPFASLSGRCAMKPRSAGHFYVEWLLLNEVAKETPSLLIS